MTFKEQLEKIKDNWLLITIAVILLFLFLGGGSMLSLAPNMMQNFVSERISGSGYTSDYASGVVNSKSMMPTQSYYPIPTPTSDFAPEETNRMMTKTASISTEVERGTFQAAETKLKSIVISSDSYLLDENVNKQGTDKKEYYVGYYTIKVDSKKYDAVLNQLKEIGEIQTATQSKDDVTGQYKDLKVEIEVEKQRLQRYQQMYNETTDIKDKIDLNDRIFNEERTIKYMEDSLKNIDQTVTYSTISMTITEKQSEYANIVIVKLSELLTALVASIVGLIYLLVVILPWALAVWLIVIIIKKIKRKKAKK